MSIDVLYKFPIYLSNSEIIYAFCSSMNFFFSSSSRMLSHFADKKMSTIPNSAEVTNAPVNSEPGEGLNRGQNWGQACIIVLFSRSILLARSGSRAARASRWNLGT